MQQLFLKILGLRPPKHKLRMDVQLCNFDTLFSKNLPHILETIFLFLDYNSFKICREVNSKWREFLSSERLITQAKCVFKAGILEDERTLHTAVEHDFTNLIKIKLSDGFVDVNCRHIYYTHFTPLHEASYRGNRDTAKLLLESGADPNLPDCWGKTPLHGAAYVGSQEVVQLLIEGGAYLNVSDEDGRTPLHEATDRGHLEVAKLLIDNGAGLIESDRHGETPLR